MFWPHVLLFSCLASLIWCFNLSASQKTRASPTQRGLETLNISRNPKILQKVLSFHLKGPNTFLSQKVLLLHPGNCVYPAGLQLRKKRWALWKGPSSKSLPVLRDNDYSFVPAEGSPQQINQNLKVTSTGVITTHQPWPARRLWQSDEQVWRVSKFTVLTPPAQDNTTNL